MSQLPPSYARSGESTNTLAFVSFVAGLVSVFGNIPLPFLGGGTLALIAIVTGFLARSEIRRSGERGTWMANVGIVIGVLHFAVLILLFLLIITGVFILGGIALLHH